MTPTTTLLRQDHSKDNPIQIGPRHGYRIEGDHAFINADLQIPTLLSGGEWTLELWATEEPYREGPLSGVKVAQIALELPPSIGPHTHQVDSWAAARLPLQGRAHAMVLALIQHGQNEQTSVHAFANYAEPQIFTAPHFEGTVGYRVEGSEVVLAADAIANPRLEGNVSGSLSLELWAFPTSGASTEGVRLAASDVASVFGQFQLGAVETRVPFNQPPAGRYQLALLLCEWTLAHEFVARDRRDFDAVYEVSAPAPAVPEVSPVSPNDKVLPPTPAADRLRLVPDAESAAKAAAETAAKAATETAAKAAAETAAKAAAETAAKAAAETAAKAAAETAAKAAAETAAKAAAETAAKAAAETAAKAAPSAVAPRLPSIQTSSVDELAKVKGLTLKLAQEIVKTRPFASLDDLVRVRGLGEKAVAGLKSLLTL